jgi:hypothetical protein
MKAPATQVYWKEWCSDIALRRCSWQAQGVLPHVLLLLHTSDDQYGVLRWPLAEIAKTAGVPLKFLRELAAKNVLKGGDVFESDFVHFPTHAGKKGEPIILVKGDGGSCWFLARLVRDEWARRQRGAATRFTEDNQPSRTPTRRVGDGSVNGPAFASASAFDSSNNTASVTPLGGAESHALALRQIGYSECSAMEPNLVAAKAEGITPEELVTIAKSKPGKPISYLVQAARGKRADAIERKGEPGQVVVPIDPAAKAAADEQRRMEDAQYTIANDFRLGIIDEATRDQRLALLVRSPAQQAAGARS